MGNQCCSQREFSYKDINQQKKEHIIRQLQLRKPSMLERQLLRQFVTNHNQPLNKLNSPSTREKSEDSREVSIPDSDKEINLLISKLIRVPSDNESTYSKLNNQFHRFQLHEPSESNHSVIDHFQDEEPSAAFFKGIPRIGKDGPNPMALNYSSRPKTQKIQHQQVVVRRATGRFQK